jgi:iron complex transport system permease protein
VITGRRTAVVTLAVLAALVGVAAIALLSGTAAVGPGDVVRALFGRRGPEADLAAAVVLGLRLPRILLAALAGAGLALAGAGFQALTRNPLADPAVLGVASGAAFGAVIGQIVGLEGSLLAAAGLSAVAFAGALLAATTVYLIASVGGRLPIQTLLLAGVITGLFFSAAITLTISLLDVTRLAGILHWLMGSLGVLGYRPVVVIALGVAGAGGLLYGQARALNLLALGEEAALQLGVEAERVKRIVFVAASLLTGVVVAHAGPIGFVGLIVPHGVRLAVGSDNRLLLPVAAGAGATFLVVADTLARVLVRPAELPVGVITAFCGAPFFVYLLRTRLRRGLA